MYKTCARITFSITGLLVLMAFLGWIVPGEILFPFRTYLEIAHFSVLIVAAFLLMHLVELKEKEKR